jgi:hypothetical protein
MSSFNNQTEYEGDEGQQADHLADDQMSLKSKLSGGGRDLGAAAAKEELRMCPACGAVTTFIQGVCSQCDYRPGSTTNEPPPFMYAASAETRPGMRILLISLIVVLLLAGGAFAYFKFFAAPKDETATAPATEQPAAAAEEAATTPESHPGGLAAVTVDDMLRDRIKTAVLAANAAWQIKKQDAFVYRFSISEKTVPATSQSIRLACYIGGSAAAECAVPPGDIPFKEALQPLHDELERNAGVSVTFSLENTGGSEAPQAGDVYTVYGYYYGKEHWAELQPVIDALEAKRNEDGQYPEMLSENLIRPAIMTNGGLSFKGKGLGYLPVFKADASGNIIMGTGPGLESYMPEECGDYYLVMFTATESDGLDLFSDNDRRKYADTISRFPYQPDGPIQNMAFHPDGKPDGIACIVKTGELQK